MEPVKPLSEATLQPREEMSNPEELLSSLKAKQRLLSQLQSEGLIPKNHRLMEQRLHETIQELEGLLLHLKESA